MRKTNRAGLALIKEYEQGPHGGPALEAYLCPAGKWTIGYGITGPQVREGLVITLGEAELMLIDAMQSFEVGVARLLKAETTDNQFAAMVCLAFNIGLGNFKSSSVLRLHNAGQVAQAAQAIGLWNKATGADGKKRELRGLTRRRADEARLYLTPEERELREDPPRTRAADTEASEAPAAQGIGKIVAVGASVSGAATAAGQVVAQAEPVWTGLQRAAGPLTPHIIMGLIGLVAVLAVCGTVYLVARQRRAG